MSGVLSTPVARRWLPQLLSGQPHQVIGPPVDPYLRRWFLLPRNRWLNLYLHQFLKSDEPDALHNHPWPFLSMCLRGGYVEITESGRRPRRAGNVILRWPQFRHRVEMPADSAEAACWTLVLTGPKVQEWGFWCGPYLFVPWTEFDGGCGEEQ